MAKRKPSPEPVEAASPGSPETLWTSDIVTRLRQLWSDGFSGGEIAQQLSEAAHQRVTRNAVMAKLNRLGLMGQGGVPLADSNAAIAEARGIWRDPAVVETLTALWTGRQHTAEAIAKKLTADAGQAVTPRAVLRKLGRLGLSGQGGLQKPAAAPAAPHPGSNVTALFPPHRPEPRHAMPPNPSDPRCGRYRLVDLKPFGQCKYPTGEDRGVHLFCGEPAPIGPGNPHGSWCEHHRSVVFTQTASLGRPAFLRKVRSLR